MPAYRAEKNVRPGLDLLVNERDRVSVLLKRFGGEMIGYDVYDPHLDIVLPLLWNNGQERPVDDHAWPDHATILFPVVGALKDGVSHCHDTMIVQRMHGFAQESLFELAGSRSSDECASITYSLASCGETRRGYPYDFVLDLTYALRGRDVSLTFKVTNTGKHSMFFQCGWHPGFDTSLGLGGKREDWQILFNKGIYRRHHCQEGGISLLTGGVSTLELDGPFRVSDQDLHSTAFLEIPDIANRVCRFINRKLALGLEMDFADFPYLAIWADHGFDFICIEPCQGIDDHVHQEPFNRKLGIVQLEPGDTAHRTATIRPLSMLAPSRNR